MKFSRYNKQSQVYTTHWDWFQQDQGSRLKYPTKAIIRRIRENGLIKGEKLA